MRVAEPTIASPRSEPAALSTPAPNRGNGLIEIELVGGRRVRVGPDVDAAALRRVIAVLDGPL